MMPFIDSKVWLGNFRAIISPFWGVLVDFFTLRSRSNLVTEIVDFRNPYRRGGGEPLKKFPTPNFQLLIWERRSKE